MRYAILGDIHSNLEALTSVTEACRNEGVRNYFCIGDIVGYGANPHECISRLKELKAVCVAGNHDWAVSGKMDYSHFSPVAQQAVDWTQTQLGREDIAFLISLPLTFRHNDFQMVHGTLNNPQRFNYLTDIALAQDTFYLMDRPVCFIGHTHKPQILVQQGDRVHFSANLYEELIPQNKYIVNVGSVGQPRDGQPYACYCIYDPDLQRIEIKRAAYDVALAQQKIMEAQLPEFLAKRLVIGQ